MYMFVIGSVLAAVVVIYYEIRLKALKGLVQNMLRSQNEQSLARRVSKTILPKRWTKYHTSAISTGDTPIEILHMFRKHSLQQFLGLADVKDAEEVLTQVQSLHSPPNTLCVHWCQRATYR